MNWPASAARGDGSVRKRLPCDLVVDGHACKALASELTPGGLFIQLSGSALPVRGAELYVELRGEIGAPPIPLRGVVLRRRHGESLAESGERGIEVRLLEAPLEYHEIFLRAPEPPPAADAETIEILIEVDEARPKPLGSDSTLEANSAPSEPEPTASSEGDRANAAAVAQTAGDSGVLPVSATDESKHSASSAPASPLEPARPSRVAADAIVVYEGSELQDVYDILEEMGAHPQRARMHGPTRFSGWCYPPMLFVIEAHDALRLEFPPGARHDDVVRIAVTSSRSQILRAMLRQRGYQYMVRRPYHRRALEILLRSALHAGAEHRDNARAPLGIEAWLRAGRWHWPRPCTLLDLSPGGGLLATHESIPLLSEVRLLIRHSASGGRLISLRGRVMRRRHDEATGEDVLALRWREVSSRQRERIEILLGRNALGPTAPPPARRRLERLYRRFVSVPQRVQTPLADLDPVDDDSVSESPANETPSPRVERRKLDRVTLDREVVALDESHERVLDVLAGRDLSLRGLRVDPHPGLTPGQRVLVSLYDPASRDTLEIEAEVARDDGPRGLALLFCDMNSATAAALEQLVAALPSLESLDSRNPARVLGQIVPTRRPAAPSRSVSARVSRRERRRRRRRARR